MIFFRFKRFTVSYCTNCGSELDSSDFCPRCRVRR